MKQEERRFHTDLEESVHIIFIVNVLFYSIGYEKEMLVNSK